MNSMLFDTILMFPEAHFSSGKIWRFPLFLLLTERERERQCWRGYGGVRVREKLTAGGMAAQN
jgi:hypothetical protein